MNYVSERDTHAEARKHARHRSMALSSLSAGDADVTCIFKPVNSFFARVAFFLCFIYLADALI